MKSGTYPRWAEMSLYVALVALRLSTGCASALTLLSSNQMVFANVDHAPMGACSTITYGYKGEPCGVGTSSGVYPYWDSWGGGVLFGLSDTSGLRLLPFVTSPTNI